MYSKVRPWVWGPMLSKCQRPCKWLHIGGNENAQSDIKHRHPLLSACSSICSHSIYLFIFQKHPVIPLWLRLFLHPTRSFFLSPPPFPFLCFYVGKTTGPLYHQPVFMLSVQNCIHIPKVRCDMYPLLRPVGFDFVFKVWIVFIQKW